MLYSASALSGEYRQDKIDSDQICQNPESFLVEIVLTNSVAVVDLGLQVVMES